MGNKKNLTKFSRKQVNYKKENQKQVEGTKPVIAEQIKPNKAIVKHEKKTSNIKRLGVKSIHYIAKQVVVEDSFSKETEILFENKYNNIKQLDKAEKPVLDGKNRNVKFEDREGKRGFVIKNELKFLRSIKRKTYLLYLSCFL